MKTELTINRSHSHEAALLKAAGCCRCACSEERFCSNCGNYDWHGYCSDGTPVSPSYYCSSHRFG